MKHFAVKEVNMHPKLVCVLSDKEGILTWFLSSGFGPELSHHKWTA